MASNDRLPQMDAIRGWAALMVVFNHYTQSVPENVRLLANFQGGWANVSSWLTPWPWLRFTPLRLVVDGGAAVDIFFVLSGFVLSLNLTKSQQPILLNFLLRRFFRIYIPFFAAICLSYVAYTNIELFPRHNLSDWYNRLSIDAKNGSFREALMMTGSSSGISVNPVSWSLIHEIRISFFMPIIFIMQRYNNFLSIIILSLFSILCSMWMQNSINGEWISTGHFIWMFSLGCFLSYNREYISVLVLSLSGRTYFITWTTSICLLMTPFDHNWSDFPIAIGAAILISLSLARIRIKFLLENWVSYWLGRVSYSLYLIHIPILILFSPSNFILSAATLTFTLICSEIFYRLFEKTSITLGRWAC